MKLKVLDKIKGALGFCQFDSCWKRGFYSIEGNVIKNSGHKIIVIECSCCKEHGLEMIKKFEEEKQKGRWNNDRKRICY